MVEVAQRPARVARGQGAAQARDAGPQRARRLARPIAARIGRGRARERGVDAAALVVERTGSSRSSPGWRVSSRPSEIGVRAAREPAGACSRRRGPGPGRARSAATESARTASASRSTGLGRREHAGGQDLELREELRRAPRAPRRRARRRPGRTLRRTCRQPRASGEAGRRLCVASARELERAGDEVSRAPCRGEAAGAALRATLRPPASSSSSPRSRAAARALLELGDEAGRAPSGGAGRPQPMRASRNARAAARAPAERSRPGPASRSNVSAPEASASRSTSAAKPPPIQLEKGERGLAGPA